MKNRNCLQAIATSHSITSAWSSRLVTVGVMVAMWWIAPAKALAWGKTGHEIVARIAGEISQPLFWQANAEGLAILSIVPDTKWKPLKTGDIERPTHYFQPDAYFSNPSDFVKIPRSYDLAVKQRSQTFVDSNGTSVWRIHQFYLLAVQAVKAGDFKRALELAGVMSHYVADNSQPLHVTKNYDGQLSGQQGIHSFYESKNVDSANESSLTDTVRQKVAGLMGTRAFQKMQSETVSAVLFAEVDRAFADLEGLLKTDRDLGRRGVGARDLLDQAEDRLADGAATLAVLLNRIWQDSANPNHGATIRVNPPAWVKPDYSSLPAPMTKAHEQLSHELDDDCEDLH